MWGKKRGNFKTNDFFRQLSRSYIVLALAGKEALKFIDLSEDSEFESHIEWATLGKLPQNSI